MVKGEENYAWFGFSLDSCQLENITLLLIGSPTWKSCARCVVYDTLLSPPFSPTSTVFKICNRLDFQLFRKFLLCSALMFLLKFIFLCLHPPEKKGVFRPFIGLCYLEKFKNF